MKKAFAATLMAGATTMALILGACGGQQASSSSAQQPANSSSQQQSSSSSSAQTSSSSSEQQAASSSAQQTSSSAAPQASSSAATQQQGTQMGEEEAKNIALKDAGVSESQVTQLSVHLETDDGVTKYDVDFHVGQKEYDYDIDPTTGAILKAKSEVDD